MSKIKLVAENHKKLALYGLDRENSGVKLKKTVHSGKANVSHSQYYKLMAQAILTIWHMQIKKLK